MSVEYSFNALTVPDGLAADAKGEYKTEKENLRKSMSEYSSSSSSSVAKLTWFRLTFDIKQKLLDLYADMVSQMLGLPHDTNEKLRDFLQDKHRLDLFKRAKDIVYSTDHMCILCIKSLRILRSEDGEDYQFRLQIHP